MRRQVWAGAAWAVLGTRTGDELVEHREDVLHHVVLVDAADELFEELHILSATLQT